MNNSPIDSECRLPQLVRFLLHNALVGAASGLVFAIALIATNCAGLLDLLSVSSDPFIPVLMLVVGFCSLFGGLYAGSAVMLLPYNSADEDDDGRKARAHERDLNLVSVAISTDRHSVER